MYNLEMIAQYIVSLIEALTSHYILHIVGQAMHKTLVAQAVMITSDVLTHNYMPPFLPFVNITLY